jgi:hypothetical protein
MHDAYDGKWFKSVTFVQKTTRSTIVRQAEDYSDWQGNVAVPSDFFVAEKWSDTPHWFRGK